MFDFFKPKISDVWPARDNWEEHEKHDNSVFWFTEKRDICRLLFTERCSWPFDLTDFTAAKKFYENQCHELGGALVEINKETIQGLEALVGVFKYKSPEQNSLAMYYVGIIWIPFEKCTYQVNFESLERGATGSREAAVSLMQNQAPVESEDEPILLESADDLF